MSAGAPGPAPAGGGLAFMLRALRYRNYRLFFAGQIISLTGTWMTNVAVSWLAYRLTGSAMLLGVVGFSGQILIFLLAPVAGIFVDRWDRRRLLIATQTLSMLQSFALAALTLSGRVDITALIALCVAQGCINAFDMPCRQAFAVEMIDKKEDLGNAIALNSSMVNVARLLGPSIGGIVIAAAGEGWCFLIDGASFSAVIGALAAMRVPERPARDGAEAGALRQMREGWNYAFGFAPIRSILLLMALVSLTGFPFMVLVPVFTAEILRGGPHTLGFLMTASGGGALLGALWLATRRTVLGLERAIPLAAGILGAGLVLFCFARTLWLSMALMLLTGFGFIIQIASSNTILQTIVEDDKRGRVMSLFTMAFLGAAPFGSLLAGGLAEVFGVSNTFAFGGACCILGALWFARELPALRKAVRPIYVKMGILPELAAGVKSAVEPAGSP